MYAKPQFKRFWNGAEAEYDPMHRWYRLTEVALRPLQPILWPLLHTVQAGNAGRHFPNYCDIIVHIHWRRPEENQQYPRRDDRLQFFGKA